jgi:hypothetical protein
MTAEQETEAEEALQPFFQMVGRVSSGWSYLEQTIDDFIWTLAGVDHAKGACITSQIQSVEWKLRAVIALIELSGGSADIIKKFKKLSGDAVSLATHRNRIVHDPLLYAFASKKVTASRMTANKTLEYSMVPVNLDEMKSVVLEIAQFRNNLLVLINEVLTTLVPH